MNFKIRWYLLIILATQLGCKLSVDVDIPFVENKDKYTVYLFSSKDHGHSAQVYKPATANEVVHTDDFIDESFDIRMSSDNRELTQLSFNETEYFSPYVTPNDVKNIVFNLSNIDGVEINSSNISYPDLPLQPIIQLTKNSDDSHVLTTSLLPDTNYCYGIIVTELDIDLNELIPFHTPENYRLPVNVIASASATDSIYFSNKVHGRVLVSTEPLVSKETAFVKVELFVFTKEYYHFQESIVYWGRLGGQSDPTTKQLYSNLSQGYGFACGFDKVESIIPL